MIFDHRVYTARPNRLNDFLKLYEDVGLPMQRQYLGEPFGFFQTHIGDLSRVVHLWQYDSLADREARRDAMEADPAWQAYRRQVVEADPLLDMRNQILKPVSFFKPKPWRRKALNRDDPAPDIQPMKLDLIVGDDRWRIACDTARAPRTLAAIAATLPTALQLHTPKIAGQHIYWHAPFVEDAEGGVDVMEAQPGAFLYWPARQFLELIFAPLQAETAEVTLLGQIEGGLPELQALGLRLREQHGRRRFAGNLLPIEGVQAPEPLPSQVPAELLAIRQQLWNASPADIEALLASRATMHPAGPLFLAESEARILHELFWWVRGSLATEEPPISRRIAAVACNKAATRLRDFCHLGESAATIFALEAAFGRDDIPLAALVDEAILCAGRLAAWLDLRIPWSAVNAATRSALDETQGMLS